MIGTFIVTSEGESFIRKSRCKTWDSLRERETFITELGEGRKERQ